MARAMSSDFLQSYRFTVSFKGASSDVPFDKLSSVPGQAGANSGTPASQSEAAFNTVTVPEISVENVEYNEGMRTNRYKQPGLPTYSDCTMTRGVVKTDSKMFEWIKAMLDGKSYRADITINHHDRAGVIQRSYTIFDAFPTRCKLAGDMDATSSEISIQEMDVAYESISLGVGNTAVHIGE